MLRFKIRQPPLPALLDRPRLVAAAMNSPVVILSAAAGSGKTCLAAQIAAATPGPVAWFTADEFDRDRAGVATQMLASIGRSWSESSIVGETELDDRGSLERLGAALEGLSRPGTIVIDDAHLMPSKVLDSVVGIVSAAAVDGSRIIVSTRADVPASLVRSVAAGQATTVDEVALAFDEDELARLFGDREGAAVLARTGGWPLAVALTSVGTDPTGPVWSRRPRHVRLLATLATDSLDDEARALLVGLARLPRVPDVALSSLGPSAARLRAFGENRPTLLYRDGGWWFLREWLRDAMTGEPAHPEVVEAIVAALLAIDHTELASRLLLSEGKFVDAVPLLEGLANDGLRRGRAMWVRSLLGSVPNAQRSLQLEVCAAAAARALSIAEPGVDDAVPEPMLRDLITRARAEDPKLVLRAQSLLADHYRMAGDARVLEICEEALGDVLTADDPGPACADRWSADDRPAAAEMLRYYGLVLLLGVDAPTIRRGQRLVGLALDLLERSGCPVVSSRAMFTYFQALLFLTSATDAVGPVRLAAHRQVEAGHSDAPVRLAELATLEYMVDDLDAARRTIELARDCAERTGNRVMLAPLAAIDVGIDVAGEASTVDCERRFDGIAAELLADPALIPFAALITAEFGLALVRHGHVAAARRCVERAEALPDATLLDHVASLRHRRLLGLVLIAEGECAEGRAVLEALLDDAACEGRLALVERVNSDLNGSTFERSIPRPLVIRVMGPTMAITFGGEPILPPRGYPARLLALLVASDGSMTIDAAVEAIWPGAATEVGRNRLHGVLLRLRRQLGLATSGPLSCVDGVVSLAASPELEVDAWTFQGAADTTAGSAAAMVDAASGYSGDVLSVQFAYDDVVDGYRTQLRRTFLRLAQAVLKGPPGDCEPERLSAVARQAWLLAPDDEDLAHAAAVVLTRFGHGRDVDDLVALTVNALQSLGVDCDRFRRRTSALRSAVRA